MTTNKTEPTTAEIIATKFVGGYGYGSDIVGGGVGGQYRLVTILSRHEYVQFELIIFYRV